MNTQSSAINYGCERKQLVLVVDDEPAILRSLSRTFHGQPIVLHTALGGKAAIEMLEKNHYDLVLSDMRMPDVDGAEVLNRAYDFYPESVRMLISGYTDHDLMIKAINDGRVHGFIEKPWNNKQLVSKVKAALSELNAKQTMPDKPSKEPVVETLQADLVQEPHDLMNGNKDMTEGISSRGRGVLLMLMQSMQQRLPEQWSHSKRVAESARLFAKYLNLPTSMQTQCYLIGRFYSIGKLMLSDDLNKKCEYQYSKAEQQQVMEHFELGKALIGLDSQLKGVVNAIQQLKQTNYTDQDRLETRINSIVIYYDKLISGQFHKKPEAPRCARTLLKEKSGVVFDPELVDNFLLMMDRCDDGVISGATRSVSPRGLTPGMKLAQPLITPKGQILLPVDTVLTQRMIDRLLFIETSCDEVVTLFIC